MVEITAMLAADGIVQPCRLYSAITGLPKYVPTSRSMAYASGMTTAGQFVADLQTERRVGNVSGETEQHLKHEFRRLGWEVSDAALATVVDAEIGRLEREAATLRKLRAGLFGEKGGAVDSCRQTQPQGIVDLVAGPMRRPPRPREFDRQLWTE